MKVLWKGYISFGLVNIPVRVHSADKGLDLHFKLLDRRDKSRIRYERVNEHTGEEVPWDRIVKAYQFSKNNFVIIKDDKTPPKNSTNIAVESFVNMNEIDPIYFDKPYYLIPDEDKTNAYFLFHEALQQTGRVGIAELTIRARQHIAVVYPYQNILVLQILRFTHELMKISEFNLTETNIKNKRLNPRAIELAEKLIDNMAATWKPDKYRDESREKMLAFIKLHAKKEKVIEFPGEKTRAAKMRNQNVITLLEKSLPHKKTKK